MSLPYLGEKPVDNPLTQISANIRQIINPNWQLQMEMQRRLMADPTYATQLADVERNAPGTLANLGFGPKLTAIVQKIPQSQESINKEKLQSLQIEDAKNSIEQFGMFKKKFQDEQTDREKRLSADETLKKFNLPNEAQAFAAGKPNPEFLQALTNSTPENRQVFMDYFKNLSQMRALSQEHELAMARINHEQGLINAREDKSFQRMLLGNAVDSYQKTGVGSVSAWRTLLDPTGSGAERMQTLMKDPTQARTQEDRNLLAIGQHTASSQQAALDAQKSSLLVKARQSLYASTNSNLKPEQVASYVNQANDIYSSIRQIDPNYNVSVVPNKRSFKTIDNNTGVVIADDSQAADVTQLPHAPNMTPRQTLDKAVQEYNSAPHGFVWSSGRNKATYQAEFKKKYGDEMFNLFKKRLEEQ